jgi:hypothetical protein
LSRPFPIVSPLLNLMDQKADSTFVESEITDQYEIV